MTKVKLHLEGLGPIYLEEDDPEFLAKILSSLAEISKSQLVKEINSDTNINMPETKTCKQENMNTTLPTVNEVVKYIISKENFAHDSVELLNKFFGRRIKSKDEPLIFLSFNNIARRARERIKKDYNIKWDTTERKSYDRNTHPIVYKINIEKKDRFSGLGTLFGSSNE
ncbi:MULTISPECIES: hypothetical protein [Methanosarcina]|uniref:hypothetical protein n=1 Tax=Methanosarcina TaxID=2207 RepID=UPI00064F8D9D|nr:MULTISPECIES: hypothetical protein [Methanosarcina]